MPPRQLPLRSIWDGESVLQVLKERHAIKLWHWLIYDVSSKGMAPDALDNVPFEKWKVGKADIDAFKAGFCVSTSKVVERLESARGDSTKLLIELQDGHRIETVIMKHTHHATVCVSSQIGCKMGCRFCATGTMGIIGDLTSGEIIEQLMHANAVTKIRNVVLMGMGEPLNNYEKVKSAVLFMVDDRRFGLSPRQVTVSTVGVLKNMRRLSDEMPLVNLALSLHAPDQETRIKIVPSAAAHHIDKLLAAVDYHIQRGGNRFDADFTAEDFLERSGNASSSTCAAKMRKLHKSGVMLEYILIDKVNDLEEHAHRLGKLLQPRREFVLLNLIPYNPTSVAEDYEPPTEESVRHFFDILKGAPYFIHTRIRGEKGQDIEGACGQLALVNPNSKKQRAQGDIEDFGSSTSEKRRKRHTNSPGKDCVKVERRAVALSLSLSLPLLCVALIAWSKIRARLH